MPQLSKHALLDEHSGPQNRPAYASGAAEPPIVFEGWLLKKRRKKMQGYGRRYFVLRASGLLTYSFEPGQVVRDQIRLENAAISSTPGRRDIHIDSTRATFHIKCLTRQDFEHWMGAFRKFINAESERTRVRRLSIAAASNHALLISKAVVHLNEMGKTIEDATEALSSLQNEDVKNRPDKSHNMRKDGKRAKQRDHKDGPSVFALFKKHAIEQKPPLSSDVGDTSLPKDSSLSTYDRIFALLEKLREQHGALSASFTTSVQEYPFTNGPTLQSINDEEESSETRTPKTSGSPILGQSGWIVPRTSTSTIVSSGSGSNWFDATEVQETGAEEFILSPEDANEDEQSLSNGLERKNERSVDSVPGSAIEGGDDGDSIEEPADHRTAIVRRTQLPAKPSGDEGSLFAVLKKSVGQDLSNIAFPVTFNEPLTLLQRSAEELEYNDLLDKAAATTDWIERISYVAAFAVSGYACTKYRSGRKGFTPLLGETFEDIRTKFIGEKVVHKPLLIAYHAEGSGWELNATSAGKTKFWGKSFEIIPTGTNQVTVGKDQFQWAKPSSFTRNLMIGTKYLEHCGEMVIRNETTGAKCVLNFKETGYWASSPNVVSGPVISSDGRTVSELEGKWDDQFSQKLGPNHLRVLWRISPFPRNASEYYGYTFFGITLNEITSDIKGKLPPTDSRFRPDLRALEEGNVPLAESEKSRLEELQRERRQKGQEPKPRWFKPVDGSDVWVYAGGYWEERDRDWKNAEIKPLW